MDYLRKLATLTNTWRSAGTAFKLRTEWRKQFGDADARHCVSNLPQRPLKGRWGYVSNSEEFYIKLTTATGQGHTKLHAVAAIVWAGVPSDGDGAATRQKRRKSNKPALEAALDNALPDDETYADTLGRWVRESLATTTDMRWWAELYSRHFSREPIAHALNCIQADNSMYSLVCNTAPLIKDELDALMTTNGAGTWLDIALDILPAEQHSDFIRQAACSCSGVGADFHRRIHLPCGALPRTLVWIVSVQQGEQSDFIQSLAQEVVALARDGKAEQFTGKLFCLFHNEFHDCAGSGITPLPLYTFMADLSAEWIVDSQRVEGTNGDLKKQMKAAPSITLKLLSARTLVKTMFPSVNNHHTHLDNVRRWDARHQVAIAAAARHADDSFRLRQEALMNDNSRWSVLDPSDIPLDEYAPMPSPAVLTKRQRTTASEIAVDQHFAAEMLVALKDMLDQSGTPWLPTASVAFELLWVRVLNSGAPDEEVLDVTEYWMAANTYYNQLWMVQCDSVRDEDPPHCMHHTHLPLRPHSFFCV